MDRRSPAPAPNFAPGVDSLISSDPVHIERVKEDMLATRKERVEGLIGIIKDKDLLWNRPPTVMAAVQILGEMRAVEAAKPLVDIIRYPDVRPPWGPRQYNSRTPWPKRMWPLPWWSAPEEGSVCEALVKIGRPCLPAVLETLSWTDDPTHTGRCLQVLYFVLGRDGAESALRAAVAGKEEAPTARLGKALERLKNAPETAEVPPRYTRYLPRLD